MSNFSFPPPPPPPPHASAPPPPPSHPPFRGNTSNLRGGRARARGGGGRGAGAGAGTGGGFRGGASQRHPQPPFHSPSVNSVPQNTPPQNTNYRLPTYPTWQQPVAQQPPYQTGLPQYPPPPFYSPPTTHNQFPQPSLQNNHGPYYGGHGLPQAPFPQAPLQPPVMGPPIRMGFGENRASGNGQHSPPANDHSARLKRKRESSVQATSSRKINQPPAESQQKPQVKTKVQVAPVVPDFGFSLPPKPPPLAKTKPNKEKKKRKKRKNNTLGLTPAGEVHEDTDESVDEEAVFQQSGRQSGDVIEIAHGGKTIRLDNAAALQAFLAERKAKYPTQAKIAAKRAELEAKKQARKENNARIKQENGTIKIKEEKHETRKEAVTNEISPEEPRLKNPAGPVIKTQDSQLPTSKELVMKTKDAQLPAQSDPAVKVEDGPFHIPQDPQLRIAYLEEQLRLAREAATRVSSSTSPIPVVKAETPDIPNRSSNLSPEASTGDVKEKSPVVIEEGSDSSEESSVLSESESDSDVPPEESSSKPLKPIKVPPPKRDLPANKTEKTMCTKFLQHGICRFGRNCRYSHDRRTKLVKFNQTKLEKPVRKSLHVALVEQELKQKAARAVEVVKFLGNGGFLQQASLPNA